MNDHEDKSRTKTTEHLVFHFQNAHCIQTFSHRNCFGEKRKEKHLQVRKKVEEASLLISFFTNQFYFTKKNLAIAIKNNQFQTRVPNRLGARMVSRSLEECFENVSAHHGFKEEEFHSSACFFFFSSRERRKFLPFCVLLRLT
jgi:hypothetical protein